MNGQRLSHEARQQLRAVVSAKLKEAVLAGPTPPGICRGCGCSHTSYTPACRTCKHRRASRRIRPLSETPRRMPLHGDDSKYRRGCRCEPCKEGHATARRLYDKAKHSTAGQPPAIEAQGLTRKEVQSR